jgi:hypothetical protein
MNRSVQPELLDELPPADPRAVQSRKDLVRVNAWMGSAALMARELAAAHAGGRTAVLLELGAGDGRFLLNVARQLPASWRGTQALLLDRLAVVQPATLQGFEELGWQAESVQGEAIAWLEDPAAPRCDVILANLFLHHFTAAPLARLLRAAATRTQTFIALEPRRSRWGAFFCRWLWLIGCNPVTQHDARVSVRAGFSGSEISRLWPAEPGWRLTERRAGRFSHRFAART